MPVWETIGLYGVCAQEAVSIHAYVDKRPWRIQVSAWESGVGKLPADMSPTCTLPYEVLFDLVNTTTEPVTMQVLQQGTQTSSQGATLLIHPRDSISLVVTAGVPYRYSLRQRDKEVTLLVKVWDDSRCGIAEVFNASTWPSAVHDPRDGTCIVMDGIKVAPASRPLRTR